MPDKAANTAFKEAVLQKREYYISNQHLLREGLQFFDSAFQCIEQPGNEDYTLFYSTKAALAHYAQRYSLANQFADTLERILEPRIAHSTYDLEKYAGVLFVKGDNYMALGKYTEAFANYFKAKEVLEQGAGSCVVSHYTYRMGNVMYRQKRYTEAKELYTQAFNAGDDCPQEDEPHMRKQALLDNIGLCYYQLGDNDSALFYYHQTLQYISTHRDHINKKHHEVDFSVIAEGVVYGNMAKVYRRLKLFDKAEELLRKSIDINLRKGHDVHDAKITMLELASMQHELNQWQSLEQTLLAIGLALDTLPNSEHELRWHQLSADFYREKKDFITAYSHLNRINEMRDSMSKATEARNTPDFDQQYTYFEQKYENKLLRQDNEQKEFSLLVAVLTTVLIVLGSLLVVHFYLRSRKDLATVLLLNEQIHQQKEQLEKALAELEANNRAKDRILHIVAHDLRNPISAISAMSQLLAEEFTPDQKNGKELTGLMRSSCTNALDLIGELLETNNGDEVPLHCEAIDVNTLLTQTVELLRFKAAEKEQAILLKLPQVSRSIYADREKLWRILNNLIVNALKFSPDKAQIEVTAELHEEYLRIAVKDYGIGIPADMQPLIFDMFTTAKRTGTKGEKSFGLGLSIVKQFVAVHRGSVHVVSETGKGATFVVELPWQ